MKNEETKYQGIFLEHICLIISVSIITSLIICIKILNIKIEEEFVIFPVMISVILFFYSLFMELPRSRYTILQMIGHLAWYISIGSALLMGWTRWINTD